MPISLTPSRIARLIVGSPSRFDLWLRLLHTASLECAAEIGVWKGDFAQAILANFSALTKYYMIDPWAHLPDWNKPFNVNDQTFEEVYAEALRKTDFAANRRIVLRGRTSAVIDEIPDQSLDFAYIDGDHTLRGITLDLIQVLPKIRMAASLAVTTSSISPGSMVLPTNRHWSVLLQSISPRQCGFHLWRCPTNNS